MDLDKELDKIAETITCLDDYQTWLAFTCDPQMDEVFDDDAYLRFSKDAVEAVKRVRYDVPYDEIINLAVSEYEDLLKQYNYPEEMIDLSVYFMFREFLNGRIAVFDRISQNESGSDEIPEMPEGDIDNLTMATIFANLPPQPEVADYLEKINVNYDYDHLHMVTWFSAQTTHGNGHYSRTEHNFSAKTTYNRLLNPYSLMWIGAALGEDPEIVQKAAADAEKVKTFAEKCGIVRRAVPFSRIYELALQMLEEEKEDNEPQEGEDQQD